MRYSMLTEEDKMFICDPMVTGKEIQDRFGVGYITPTRWRKKLGVSLTRGCKKGKERPWQRKIEKRSCIICSTSFEVKPSERKKLCSKKCVTKFQKSRDKSYMQTEEYKDTLRKDTTPDYRRYAQQVHSLSQKVYEKNIDIINPNRYTRTLCGVDGGFQLDHIIPIRYGFDNGIFIEEMCVAENLRMLPWKENLGRNRKNKNVE